MRRFEVVSLKPGVFYSKIWNARELSRSKRGHGEEN